MDVSDPHEDAHHDDENPDSDKEEKHISLGLAGEMALEGLGHVSGAIMRAILFQSPKRRLRGLGFGLRSHQ